MPSSIYHPKWMQTLSLVKDITFYWSYLIVRWLFLVLFLVVVMMIMLNRFDYPIKSSLVWLLLIGQLFRLSKVKVNIEGRFILWPNRRPVYVWLKQSESLCSKFDPLNALKTQSQSVLSENFQTNFHWKYSIVNRLHNEVATSHSSDARRIGLCSIVQIDKAGYN